MKKTKQKNVSLILFFVLIIVFFQIYGLAINSSKEKSSFVELCSDWTVQSSDFSYENADLSVLRFKPLKRGDTLTYFRILPKTDVPHPTLILFTIHSDIEVFLDGKTIYRYGQELFDNERLVGYGYHVVDLPDDYAGMELKVSCRVSVKNAFTDVNVPMIYDGTRFISDFTAKNASQIMISNYLLVFGLMLVMISIFFLASNSRFFRLLYSGLFSIGVALWSICNYNLIILLTDSKLAKVYVEFVALYFTPLPFMLYFWEDIHKHAKKSVCRIYEIVVTCQVVFIVASCTLQAINLVDFPDVLWIQHLILGVMIFFTILVSVEDIIKGQFRHKVISVGFVVMLSTGGIDLLRFNIQKYISLDTVRFNSVLCTGTLIFVMGQIIEFCTEISRAFYEMAQTETLEKMAYTDALTGLYNRRRCEEEFEKLSMGNTKYGILSLDLNNLKKVNDSKGHEEGDILITEFATALKAAFGEETLVARMGGDEFLVIIYDTRKNKYESYIKRLYWQIENANERNPKLNISVAYGYCRSDEMEGMDVREVYKKADERMYEMKVSMKK